MTLTGYLALNSVFEPVWLAETVQIRKIIAWKLIKIDILSAVQIFGWDRSFWRYKACADTYRQQSMEQFLRQQKTERTYFQLWCTVFVLLLNKNCFETGELDHVLTRIYKIKMKTSIPEFLLEGPTFSCRPLPTSLLFLPSLPFIAPPPHSLKSS